MRSSLSLLATVFSSLLLFACSTSTGTSTSATDPLSQIGSQAGGAVVKVNDAFLNDLQGIMNTAGPDIQNAENTANTTLPSTGKAANPDMAQCLGGALSVQKDVSAILTSAGTGTNGAVTAATLADTFVPNGPLYNQEEKTLVTACTPAAIDVLQSQGQMATTAAVAGVVVSQLGTIAPVLGAAIP